MEKIVDSAFLFLLLSTCCLGWPAVLRRSSNFAPQTMTDPRIMENQWELARAPTIYEQEDYYDPQISDIDELANLIDYYDNPSPIWGHIVNEKPESELEELKTISNHHEGSHNVGRFEKKSIITSVAPPVITTTKSSLENQLKAEAKAETHRVGQKEIPLLRPPVIKGKEAMEPIITQRAIEKKPSPLDTLRRMMSIEDNLIKGAEKRRDPMQTLKKRNFVENDDQLTGQLNNLKKAMF